MSNRTPLEETFDLPSLSEINKTQSLDDETVEESEYHELDEIDNIDNITMSEEDLHTTIMQYNSEINITRQEGISIAASDNMKDYMEKMADVHSNALGKFEDLMSSIMSMEAGVGAKYLVSAVKLLDIAKDAQNTSMDRVIRMERLYIEREKHDADMADLVKKPKGISDGGDVIEYDEDGDNAVDDAVYVVEEDRNTILKRRRAKLLKQSTDTKDNE